MSANAIHYIIEKMTCPECSSELEDRPSETIKEYVKGSPEIKPHNANMVKCKNIKCGATYNIDITLRRVLTNIKITHTVTL